MSTFVTSEMSPLRVDFLDALPGPGRIGMTFAPGKTDDAGSVLWRRDLQLDLTRLRDHYGADVLVSLIEDHELDVLGIRDLVAQATACGIEVVRFPICDLSVPASMPDALTLVRQVIAAHASGRTIVLHCRGGLGRTGLLAAACLVALGHGSGDAIAAVRQTRPGAVETTSQKQWVARFEAAFLAL